MKDLIGRICQEHQTGLQLINQPTGSGKTYSINRFIHDYFTKGEIEDKRNVIVVTTNKNNLDFRKLEEMFIESGNKELFYHIFLYLDSISNLVIENYCESMDEDIYRSLGRSPAVCSYITAISNIKRSTDASGKESPAVKDAIQRFAKDIEPPVRRMIRRAVRQERHGFNDRLRFIEGTPEWKWVSELYPSIYTRNKKLFFMSADKFVMRNDTIIDVSNLVYESPIANNAIIFIDEFDSTKNQILSRVVEDSIRNQVDYLDMFQKIYQSGVDIDIDPDFYSSFEETNIDLKALHSSKIERIKDIRRRYHLESPVVLDQSIVDTKSFIFKSDVTFTVNDSCYGMTIRYDRERKKNIISSERGRGNRDLLEMFKDIDLAIDGYCHLIRSLAYNYYKKNSDPTQSFDDCIYTILDLYGITRSMPSYLSHLSRRILVNSKSPRRFIGADSSIYEKGYECFSFYEDNISRERAHVQLISGPVSAEKVILKVCERAMVFAVSATAGIKTVLGNYDLDYLRSRLGDYYLPPIDEEPRLLDQIDMAYGNYGSQDIRWDIKSISSGEDGAWDDSIWDDVFIDEKHARVVIERTNGIDDFHLRRYHNLAVALKALLFSDTKRNGLFFCNMNPSDNSKEFDTNVIKQMFDILVREYSVTHPNGADVKLYFLKKDDFDNSKRTIRNRMAEGLRTAVITSYGTLSTGQNLQFGIPAGLDVRNVSRLSDGEEMDIDMVYLQTPTHLIHSPQDDDYEKERSLHICDIHYLKSNGEITQGECKRAVSNVLSGNRSEIGRNVGIANNSKSGHMSAAIKLIQAIGRTCRTNMKNPEISIYYDESISKFIDHPIESYGVLSPESRHFLEHGLMGRVSPPDTKRLEDLAVFRSHNANNIIHSMLGWHDKSTISDYRAMRHDLLCNPSTDVLNNTAYQMYVELPVPSDHYWCSYKGEYDDLVISFDKPLPKGTRMDSKGLRFNELFTIPGLMEHFESMGYATELKVGRYLISPVAAKNLLMGMHGEVAGRFIIDPKGEVLKDMDERHFEKFDFQMNDSVAVDFKHWTNDQFTSGKVQHSKIIEKMKETGHKTVYVINILLPEGKSHESTTFNDGGLKIVKVPWLFDPVTRQFNDGAISEIRRAAYATE